MLVVDDEPAVGLALSRILREHEVSTVSSVSDALALIASGKPFDVIFSDLMMPQVTGIEFYEELTRLSPREAVHVKGGTRNGSALCKIARRYISNRS
ncbi:MAG: response regulator [Polyangiaceae bacterium]